MFNILFILICCLHPAYATDNGKIENVSIQENCLTHQGQIKEVLSSEGFSAQLVPLSFETLFERDSLIVRNKIKEFFPGNNERLDDFELSHAFGSSLLRPSLFLHGPMLLFIFPLLSENTTYRSMDWKNPQVTLDWLKTPEAKENFYGNRLARDYFFLPILSGMGFGSIPNINRCFSRNIAFVGIPYANKLNNYDLVEGASILEFALHDVGHAGMLSSMEPHFYSDGKSHDCSKQRQAIYDDIQGNGSTRHETPYFLTFHEDGQSLIASDRRFLNPNPIQNTIEHYNFLFPSQVMSIDDYFVESILSQYKKGPFYPVIGYGEGNGGSIVPEMDMSRPVAELIKSDIDVSSFVDFPSKQRVSESSSLVTFALKSRPQDTFRVAVAYEFGEVKKSAIDIIKLLNQYGTNIDMNLNPENFDLQEFRTFILGDLEAFNHKYGHLFETH